MKLDLLAVCRAHDLCCDCPLFSEDETGCYSAVYDFFFLLITNDKKLKEIFPEKVYNRVMERYIDLKLMGKI